MIKNEDTPRTVKFAEYLDPYLTDEERVMEFYKFAQKLEMEVKQAKEKQERFANFLKSVNIYV